MFSAETNSCDSCDDPDDDNGLITVLATLLAIAVIGLVISIVINVFFVVQRKRSWCVVTRYILVIYITICCRYDVNQSNKRYSDVKHSLSIDYTIKDPLKYKPSEPEYEAVETDNKPTCDVKMDANPAYQATS